jgi:hypothetical protein
MTDETMLQALAIDDADDLTIDETARTVALRGVHRPTNDVRVSPKWLREQCEREGREAAIANLRQMAHFPNVLA